MAPFVRTLVARTDVGHGPDGTMRSVARVDDHFHGFEVCLTIRGDEVLGAEAVADRYPWSTCPGAVASIGRLRTSVVDAPRAMLRQGRADTCVHLNELVWLAAKAHRRRSYEAEVTPSGAGIRRDGVALFGWRLGGWRVTSPGPFEGLFVTDDGWGERLVEMGADDDTAEAVRILRRAVHVSLGYFVLDWPRYRTADDVELPVLANSCHTFSDDRIATAVRLVEPPDTTLFR